MSQSSNGDASGVHSVTIGRKGSGPRLCLVAALASNRVIGVDFRALTMGHPVIMGRRTWESIGRALPGRRNIVVTRQPGFVAAGAQVAASLDESIALCADAALAFVIGGAALYAAALPIADALELTEIDAAFEGDTHFPAFERGTWREVRRERHRHADGLRFDFVRYERAALRSAAA
jgi:dihydrofolate reductase